jgi:hypothetical protein
LTLFDYERPLNPEDNEVEVRAMAFLDFMNDRQGQRPAGEQQSQQDRKPETAKEMYTREAAQDKANRIPATAEQKEQAQKIGTEMRQANEPNQEPSPSAPSAPEDRGSNAAQLQNQSNQGKEQKALSPTDDAAGKTAVQEKQQSQEKQTQRPQQTVARRPPSWER